MSRLSLLWLDLVIFFGFRGTERFSAVRTVRSDHLVDIGVHPLQNALSVEVVAALRRLYDLEVRVGGCLAVSALRL